MDTSKDKLSKELGDLNERLEQEKKKREAAEKQMREWKQAASLKKSEDNGPRVSTNVLINTER